MSIQDREGPRFGGERRVHRRARRRGQKQLGRRLIVAVPAEDPGVR